MTHKANQQAYSWGTGAPRDGDKLPTAFTKTEDNLDYQFDLADTQPRLAATVAAIDSMTNKQADEIILTAGRVAAGDGGRNEYMYKASGKSLITTNGGFLVSIGAGDDYVEACASAAGFNILAAESATLRTEANKPVAGLLFVAQRDHGEGE